MSEIRRFPFLRHLRSEPSSHIMVFRNGKLVKSGPGLNAWIAPLSSGVVEIPIDDREMQFVFHGRSADFQDVTVQGVITYRVAEPATLARRIDFAIDLDRGRYRKQPLERLELLVSQLAQQFAWAYLAATPIREALIDGPRMIRLRVAEGLADDSGLEEMGLALVSVRVSRVQPTSDLERALEAPMREQIQQLADEAGFERRALAVENERAIQENELKNQIELSRREEELIAQRGQNSRREAEEEAEARRIQAEAAAARSRVEAAADADQTRVRAAGEAESTRLTGAAEAETIQAVEQARVDAEKQRVGAYGELPPAVLFGLAARELGRKLEKIEHLNLSPELFTPLIAELLEAGTKKLAGGSAAGGSDQ